MNPVQALLALLVFPGLAYGNCAPGSRAASVLRSRSRFGTPSNYWRNGRRRASRAIC
jgi:hypothetical protein